LQQLFPLQEQKAAIHYGVPFGANSFDNIMPKSGPRAVDEIKADSWKQVRHIHDWIHAGNAEWGLTIAANQQLMKVEDGLIRAEMLRGPRYTSVKVVRGQEVTSMQYPPIGTYVFRYSLSAGRGDWKTAKSYRTGMDFNNALVPVSVVDRISTRSLPPTNSFASVTPENLVISAVKKADRDESLVLRLYEIEGSRAETALEFLGRKPEFRELNLLEEETDPAAHRVLKVTPYGIKTLKLRLGN